MPFCYSYCILRAFVESLAKSQLDLTLLSYSTLSLQYLKNFTHKKSGHLLKYAKITSYSSSCSRYRSLKLFAVQPAPVWACFVIRACTDWLITCTISQVSLDPPQKWMGQVPLDIATCAQCDYSCTPIRLLHHYTLQLYLEPLRQVCHGHHLVLVCEVPSL